MLVKEKNTYKYSVAFRGTADSKDIDADIEIGLTNNNPQFRDARDFVQTIINTNENITKDNLTLTGHSLGGILAQQVGAELRIQGYTYNAFGADSLVNGLPHDVICQPYFTLRIQHSKRECKPNCVNPPTTPKLLCIF